MRKFDKYLVISIDNSAKCFTKAWSQIKNLREEDKSKINKEDYSNCYLFDASGIEGRNGRLIQAIQRWIQTADNVVWKDMPVHCGLCFWIKDCVDNDTIEYQYLALMLQNIEDTICYIYPDDNDRAPKVYRNICSYFSFFIQNSAYRGRIWIANIRDNKLGIEEIKFFSGYMHNAYRIMPVLEFVQDRRDISFRKWTRTVGEFLSECVDIEQIKNLESKTKIDSKLKYIRAKQREVTGDFKGVEYYTKKRAEWQEKKNKWENWIKVNSDNEILYRCIDYFTSAMQFHDANKAEYYRELFWGREIQTMLSGTSLLTLYILCLQLYFMKEKDKMLDVGDIKLLFVNAQEIVDGIIQLLENLHHTSEKCGLFSIRIHKNDDARKYLYNNYRRFREKNPNVCIFEFRILDYSNQGIIESFAKNQGYHRINDNFRVKSFFEYIEEDDFWQEYNKKPSNLVHHYGLQIFSTIISNNGGYFEVVSSSNQSVDMYSEYYTNCGGEADKPRLHIPGTEYVVLLPMKLKSAPINPAVEADIQYRFDLKDRYRMVPFDIDNIYKKSQELLCSVYEGQKLKEKVVENIKKSVLIDLQSEESRQCDEVIVLLSAKYWNELKTEIFCKALMLCLIEWKPKNQQGFYVIVRNCDSNDFIAITRMFAIFYGKCGLNMYMDKLQMYLSGVDQSEEFLIAGSNISALMTIARKLTLVRGIQPECMKSIEYILEKYGTNLQLENEMGHEIELVPFDVLQMPEESEKTLFERAVKKVLESDIQRHSFGCKISETHMRLGSKLHINEFYEAELLFHNNYYVARFALLVIRHLEKVMQKHRPVMLVGYETYSELLLYEIISNLKEKGYDCSYMVYEQHRKEKFRYNDSNNYIKDRDDIGFILIVPINSSMTTHSKLRASLILEVKKIRPEYDVKVVANYALILIRSKAENRECDDMECKYCISMKNGTIKTKYLPAEENEIYYCVCVNTKWHHPLKCKFCFPKTSMLDERPLIETNRSSIIPVQLLGIREPTILDEESFAMDKETNMERIKKLGDSLVYKHIVRKGNHFMYYFLMEKYFMQNRENIIDWLRGLKNYKKAVQGIVYDIIVAPLHYSNAGFVAEVNHYLFGNAALVLNFEVEKEFRENVKTKYSNIIGLYKKLVEMGKEAELRFHFVDDNIITSGTFFRAKSLFSSLLPRNQDGKVKVKVFEDIIVILNRMSTSSIMNCVRDRNDYYAYVSLNISSMRNHEDACTLCKVVENAKMLRDCSATNEMYEFWDKKIVRHRIIKAEEYLWNGNEEQEQHQRAYRRMLCNHIINDKLSELGYLKNDTDEVEKVMLHLIEEKEESKDVMEWIISYIKIFSRPFVSFRKSNREAAFRIMLQVMEFILDELKKNTVELRKNRFKKYRQYDILCRSIRDAKIKYGENEKILSLLLTLMKRLSELGSNYVIRKQNIIKIFRLLDSLNLSDEKREEFKKRYSGIVKRIVSLSSDESKCIYLEYLILFGEEYIDEKTEERTLENKLCSNFGLQCEKDFVNIIFLENTRVLYDGIRDMEEELPEDISEAVFLEVLEKKYYYENLTKLLRYYNFLGQNEDSKYFVDASGKRIIALVMLYRMLTQPERGDVEVFYDQLLNYAEVITGAKKAKLLFFYEINENGEGFLSNADVRRKVYKKEYGMEILLDGVDELEYNYEEAEYHDGTYSVFQEENKKVLIEYRNYVGEKYSVKEKNQLKDVFLELEFDTSKTDLEMMISLKMMMVFRNLLVENLEKDFSNNLMQKWSSAQTFKRNMKLERAADHTDRDDLAAALEMVTKETEWSINHESTLFYLVLNSYIARINVQLLTEAPPEGEPGNLLFEFVYLHQLKPLIDKMSTFETFKIIDKSGKEGISNEILKSSIRMYKDETRYERISVRRLSIIIIELIHSAIKYSDDQIVYIYRENEFFVVKNSFESNREISVIKKEAQDSYSRKKEGISLAVIKELVDKFYCLDKENGVIIDAEEIGQKKFYYVKLPILEIERNG